MKVSVIVPVRDEEHSIRELLDSLLQQTRPPDEIVITDGGSVDATPQIIEEYIQQGAPIRLIRTDGSLPGRARNLSAAQASFNWLGFTDAGIRVAKDWLETLVARAEEDDSSLWFVATSDGYVLQAVRSHRIRATSFVAKWVGRTASQHCVYIVAPRSVASSQRLSGRSALG